MLPQTVDEEDGRPCAQHSPHETRASETFRHAQTTMMIYSIDGGSKLYDPNNLSDGDGQGVPSVRGEDIRPSM